MRERANRDEPGRIGVMDVWEDAAPLELAAPDLAAHAREVLEALGLGGSAELLHARRNGDAYLLVRRGEWISALRIGSSGAVAGPQLHLVLSEAARQEPN